MKFNILPYLVLVFLVGSAGLQVNSQEDRAPQWFHSEYSNFFKTNLNDTTPPNIALPTVVPSILKVSDPIAEIIHAEPHGNKPVHRLLRIESPAWELQSDYSRRG